MAKGVATNQLRLNLNPNAWRSRLKRRVRGKRWECRFALCILSFCVLSTLHSQGIPNQLANTTILVIRHAEDADSSPGLSPQGVQRAKQYADYFEPFREQGMKLSVNSLFAGADSAKSVRPRLTLEPLSQTTGLPLDTRFSTDSPEDLVRALSTEHHGNRVLIAWRHKAMPALLHALGADPESLLPDGVWPGHVYDWVILLRYDAAGHLQTQKLIHETLPVAGE
jgi:hypothetical protein